MKGQRAVFGDGSHPTTRLCAGAVDLLCRERQPHAVLDVGTGTGVLVRIARARGARFIAGTDIDPAAIAFAKEACESNDGDVIVEIVDRPPDAWGPRFDIVVANILEEPLLALAPSIARALAPGGALLLSGFTPRQTPVLRDAYAREGLAFVRQAQLGEWALLMFERPA
jgi:ribosomal protein L11 methyltransferase